MNHALVVYFLSLFLLSFLCFAFLFPSFSISFFLLLFLLLSFGMLFNSGSAFLIEVYQRTLNWKVGRLMGVTYMSLIQTESKRMLAALLSFLFTKVGYKD